MKRLALLLVVACSTASEPVPPPPVYDPATLLVENQSGVAVDFLAECCGGAQLPAVLQPTASICINMFNIIGSVTVSATGAGYQQRDSLPSPHSSPAWTWTLSPVDAQLRTATTPCG